jgi:hypothetical protein
MTIGAPLFEHPLFDLERAGRKFKLKEVKGI